MPIVTFKNLKPFGNFLLFFTFLFTLYSLEFPAVFVFVLFVFCSWGREEQVVASICLSEQVQQCLDPFNFHQFMLWLLFTFLNRFNKVLIQLTFTSSWNTMELLFQAPPPPPPSLPHTPTLSCCHTLQQCKMTHTLQQCKVTHTLQQCKVTYFATA